PSIGAGSSGTRSSGAHPGAGPAIGAPHVAAQHPGAAHGAVASHVAGPQVAAAAPAGIAPHHGSLAVERELVATAREALLAHDFAAAEVALDRHARRFPVGQLAEERDSLR